MDIGGIPSDENKIICAAATHAILLAGDTSKFPEWREFCGKLNLSILAEIWSDYHGQEDVVPEIRQDNVWHGSVHHLERGELVHERPTVAAIARILVRMATVEEQK